LQCALARWYKGGSKDRVVPADLPQGAAAIITQAGLRMTSTTKPAARKAEKPVAKGAAVASQSPRLFRVSLEVSNLDKAKAFYEELLGVKARKLPLQRLEFDLGGCALQIVDVSSSGPSHPCAKAVHFAVPGLDAVHKRARKLKCLSLELVHDRPGGAIHKRPWGDRSFYVDDPWFNSLCFVQQGTETGR
jgi:catechol 2,3-dioxygenase-like lactoylglutathione lyase family enzyme